MKKFFKDIFSILVIALFFYVLEIRVCPFFSVFGIPCPGCGITRATLFFLQGQLLQSLRYNFLASLLIFSCIIYIIVLLLKKEKELEIFIEKYKVFIISLAVILVLLAEIVNINNELLYWHDFNNITLPILIGIL